jgi:FAD/FMN-containing dehydrogenase
VLPGGVVKESAGYDLGALLAGSEGTLAVLTAVRLRLVPLLPYRVVAVVGVADTAAAQRVLAAVRRRAAGLSAAELFHADGLALVRAHTGLPPPLGAEHPSYLLVECAGQADPTDALAAALDGLTEVRDVAVATDPPGREALWRYREAHPEAVGAVGIPVKLDIAVPPAVLPAAESTIRAAVLAVAPSAQVVIWGHLAEANLHVNVLSAGPRAEEITDAVLRTAAAHGGSISAEHGIGRAKAPWLTLTRSPNEIAVMRAVKSALDPRGLLNPGALFAPDR